MNWIIPLLAEAAEKAHGASDKTVLDSFEEGGAFMWPILFIGIAVWIIIFERYYVLYFKTTSKREVFVSQMRKLILQGKTEQALQYANMDSSPIGRIVKAGLMQIRKDDEVVGSAMDEAALEEVPKLEKRTGFLAMLSNVATLTGLLGTVAGLISSFEAVSQSADASKKAELLAAGISEAMNCTAFGLLVAIPALLFYSLLQNRTTRCIEDINSASLTVVNMVIVNREKLGLGPGGSSGH